MYNSAPQYTCIKPRSTASYKETKLIHRYIKIRYNNHTRNSFEYQFNTFKQNPSFTLRETNNRSQIQLSCSSEDPTHYCPNYGKFLQTYSYALHYTSKTLCTPDHHTHMFVENSTPDLLALWLSTKFWIVVVGICVHSTTRALVRSGIEVR